MAAKGLTPKQQRFVEEYLVDLNATAAYKRAGYRARSETVARVESSRLLAKPSVSVLVEAAKAKRSERVEVKQDDVLRELARVAFGDLRKIAQWGGLTVSFTDSEELDDNAAAFVAGIKSKVVGNTGTKDEPGDSVLALEVKTHDKVKALELLGRHLGMFDDRLRVIDDRPPKVELGGDVPPEVLGRLGRFGEQMGRADAK